MLGIMERQDSLGNDRSIEFYLDRVDRVEEQLADRLNGVVSQIEADNSFLHTRVTNVEENLTKRIEENSERVLSRIDRMSDQFETKFLHLDSRVTAIERWRWLIVGGGSVIIFLLINVSRISDVISRLLDLHE
jgi:hypothetical protein